MRPPLVLASQSPRRKELLGVLGPLFTVIPAEIAEVPLAGEKPEQFVARAAREKGIEVASRVSGSIVLSADTIVTIDGLILGKPADEKDAVHMLKRLSGREHAVYTAVCVIDQPQSQMLEGLQRTNVWFNPMTDDQIVDYVEREDVLDKAGAYAIQGYASVYISKIEGNYTNVMGLPMPLVYDLLKRVNVYF
jgi:septum formation protein